MLRQPFQVQNLLQLGERMLTEKLLRLSAIPSLNGFTSKERKPGHNSAQ